MKRVLFYIFLSLCSGLDAKKVVNSAVNQQVKPVADGSKAVSDDAEMVKVIFDHNSVLLNQEQVQKLSNQAKQEFLSEPSLVKGLVYKFKEVSDPKTKAVMNDYGEPQDLASWHCNDGFFATQLPSLYTSGTHYLVKTEDGVWLDTYFHNRDSDTLIVVAPGFNNLHYSFLPFLVMFKSADIVFLNFRGCPSRFTTKIWNTWFKVNPNQTCLGQREELDVIAVTEFFKKRKRYDQVVGVGMCFGAAMIAKAQAKHSRLFSKLIFDSLWPNSSRLIDNFLKDINLFVRPQKTPGGFWSKLGKFVGVRKGLKVVFEDFLFGREFPLLDICPFLKKIRVPVLFFYGTDDLLISPVDFTNVYNAVSSRKMAIITKSKHLLSFLKHRFVYQGVAQSFIDEGISGIHSKVFAFKK